MKLGQMLLLEMKKYKRHKLPAGNLYEGKYRIVIPPTKLEVHRTAIDLQVEEKNMFYLRHPYLNAKESRKHKAAWTMYRNSMTETITYVKQKWSQPKLMSKFLSHMKVSESWE